MSTDSGTITRAFIGFMLVMINAILYERTVVSWASMDLGKGLGRSEP